MAIEVNDAWIGVQGGTCAGKTTLAEALAQQIGPDDVLIVSLDLFYRPIERRFLPDATDTNFDTPSSLDWQLLRETVKSLRSGNSTVINVYDGLVLSRTLKLNPQKYTIVEGLWTFNKKFLSDIFGLKVYVETSSDIRLIRRLTRDVINAQEWSLNQMLSYYVECIRPLHSKFVETGKANCDVMVSGESNADWEAKRVLEALSLKYLKHQRSAV